jgi:hypothetical protein
MLGLVIFCNLFSYPHGYPIKEILEVVELFPRSITEEINESL